MNSIIDYLKSVMPGKRKHWLSDQKPQDLPAIQQLVDTGAGNKVNYISLKQDPAAGAYWIQHFIDEGMGHWFEYQPITPEQAQALKDDPEKWRDFVLHDWVER